MTDQARLPAQEPAASRWVYRPVLDIHQLGDVQAALSDYMRFYERVVTPTSPTYAHFAGRVVEIRKLLTYLLGVQGEFLPLPPQEDSK